MGMNVILCMPLTIVGALHDFVFVSSFIHSPYSIFICFISICIQLCLDFKVSVASRLYFSC